MATTFMNLTLPVPTTTLGPAWASELSTALDVIDQHDHSSGKGTKVKVAGLNIDADLDIQSNRLLNVRANKHANLGASLTGAANANSVFVFNGNLYFTNASGSAVQITSGGSIASVPGTITAFQFNSVNTNLAISASDPFVYLSVDTSAARTIDLPAASSVSQGRFYIIKDETGSSETNNITINADGSDTIDGAASVTVSSNFGALLLVGNGVNKWNLS